MHDMRPQLFHLQSFYSFLAFSSIFLINHHIQDKNIRKNTQNNDKQDKNIKYKKIKYMQTLIINQEKKQSQLKGNLGFLLAVACSPTWS